MNAVGVIAEARALADALHIERAPLDAELAALAPHLGRYAELVVSRSGLEIITGGVGIAEELAALVAAGPAASAFLACARAFPDRMLGLKLCFGTPAMAPTLYVRTMAPRATVRAFLDEITTAAAALDEALAGNEIAYGLGFSSDARGLVIKTYTVADVGARAGFVSFRVRGGVVTREVKKYLPDLEWSEVPGDRAWIDDVRARVPCARVGHVGLVNGEAKLYLERIGAIPSDFNAR